MKARAEIALALAVLSSAAGAQSFNVGDDAAGFADAAAARADTEIVSGYLRLRAWSDAERSTYPSLADNTLLLHFDEASVVNGTPLAAAGTPPAGVAPVFQSTGAAEHSVPGVVGSALSFAPVTQDRVRVLSAPADLASNTTAVTLMAWFKPRAWPTSGGRMRIGAVGGTAGTRADFALFGPTYVCTQANANDAPWVGTDVPVFPRLGEWSHLAVVFDFPANRITDFVEGRLLAQVPVGFAGSTTSAALSPSAAVGSAESSATQLFDGEIDEFSVWKRALGAAEIAEIHRRQSGAFGTPWGTFASRPLAAPQDVAWTAIGWTPRAPYGKPLPGASQNESGYPEGNADMTGNVLLLRADGSGSPANGATLTDASSRGHWARVVNADGAGSAFVPGRLGEGVHLVPPDYLSIDSAATSADFDYGTGDFTWAAWARSGPCAANDQVVMSVHAAAGNPEIWIGGGCSAGCDDTRAQWVLIAGGATTSLCSDVRLDDGSWHHLAGVKSAGSAALFVDGRRYAASTSFTNPFDFDQAFLLGQSDGLTAPSDVSIDELAIWRRALTDAEVGALYHRGALRLGLQVRTCLDPPCTGAFVGPDGTAGTVFSEASNAAPTPTASAPAALPALAPGQHLEYRAVLESDDPTASPELASVGFVAAAVPLPSAVADAYQLIAGAPFTSAAPGVLANDSASGPLTAQLLDAPAHGTVDLLATGQFTYTPAGAFVGADAFRYRAFDGSVRSGPVQVFLEIVPPPVDAPVITSPATDEILHTNLPVFAGTAMAGVAVSVTVDGAAVGEATADEGGQWALAVGAACKLANGSHQATATARNSYGGVSAPSTPVGFAVQAMDLWVTCGCGAGAGGPVLLAVALVLLGSRRRRP